MSAASVARRSALVLAGALAVGVLVWRLPGRVRSVPEQREVPVLGVLKDFSLTDRGGRPFTLADMKGNLWVADFIFTRCGGPCPRLSGSLTRLQNEFEAEPRLRFLTVTVDPDHDTPAVLEEYAQRFYARERWRFLSGPPEDVRRALKESFQVAAQPNPDPKAGPGEAFIHSPHLALVDAEGRVRGYFANTPEDLARLSVTVRRLLRDS
jgi:cytochrome oxidase Cu insertion factor (SCO1/SenC/PrrC family)